MTGHTYLLRGRPVTVVTGFTARVRDLPPAPPWLRWQTPPAGPPRNVAVREDVDGRTLVRPWRDLHRKEAP